MRFNGIGASKLFTASEPSYSGNVDFPYQGECFKTHYVVAGDLRRSKQPPFVVLHGGPGFSHHYTRTNLQLYSLHGIPVVLYDQIGNGDSSHLREKPASFFTMQLFMDELQNLLTKLGIADRFDLLGHSWGAMLASTFAAVRQPPGLRRLIIANGPASMALWVKSTAFVACMLPNGLGDVMKRCEADGSTSNPEYQRASALFWRTFICQVEPDPVDLEDSKRAMGDDSTVYEALMGDTGTFEINNGGTMVDWNIIPSLPDITCPTLLLNGKSDEFQDFSMQPYFDNISDVDWHVFKGSHIPWFEEPADYFEVVGTFLKK